MNRVTKTKQQVEEIMKWLSVGKGSVCVCVLLNPCGRIVNVWSSVSDASLCSGANCGFELVALAERAQWETHPLWNDRHVWSALCRSSRPVSWISSGSILWLSHQQVGEPKNNNPMRADTPLCLSALLSEADLLTHLCIIWRHNYSTSISVLSEYIHTNISVFITVSSSPNHKTSRQSCIFHAKIILCYLRVLIDPLSQVHSVLFLVLSWPISSQTTWTAWNMAFLHHTQRVWSCWLLI